MAGGRACLGGVGLVGYHSESAVSEGGVLADLVYHERKRLQRHDDYRGFGAECLDQLLGLHALALDAHDHAFLVLELIDRFLQLRVEHGAVGDDDHGVEHLLLLLVVQACQPVCQPGNRVRLARACGVLDQVVMPRSLPTTGVHQLIDGFPLVVTREDKHSLRLTPTVL